MGGGFGVYLAELRRKNPQMSLVGTIKLTIESFEAQLRRAFEAGARSKAIRPDIDALFGDFLQR